MDSVQEAAQQEELALNSRLSQVHEKLDGLVQNLRSVEDELEALSEERQRHDALQKVCGGLVELHALGGSELFWGEHASEDQTHTHLRLVQGRQEAFEKHLGEIQDRRELVLEEIEREQVDAEFIEDDLFEVREREELRKREWVIEREVDEFPFRLSVMPWARGNEEDKRFRKALAVALLLSLLLGVVFPLIKIPIAEIWEPTEVPTRLAKLIQEARPLPPPPAPVQEEVRPEEAASEAPEKLAKESTPAKKKAAAPKGILAFRKKFSGLSQSMPAARLGAQARIRKAGTAASGRPQRSLVTSQLPGASGGIDVGSLSRDVGGGGEGIAGVEIARATSAIGTVGGGSDRPLSDGPGPARTDEEIQIVFDRHKAALYRLYNRELRRDPTLRGQMVLRMRIEPDGGVSLCEVQSTAISAPNLSTQVVARVKTFDFGPKEGVSAITILYPIDFLPAT